MCSEMKPLTLTVRDQIIVKCVVHDNWQEAIKIAEQFGWLVDYGGELSAEPNPEREECERKLTELDLTIPWDVL